MVMLADSIPSAQLPIFLNLADKRFIAETKEDGVRVRMRIKDNKVHLTNRRGIDCTIQYPELHNLTTKREFFIDGEMCVLDDNGVSQFNDGISFRSHCKSPSSIESSMQLYPVTYVVFDCLEVDGVSIRDKPFSERREVLEQLNLVHPHIKLVEQFHDVKSAWNKVVSGGWEGLILKNLTSEYREGYRSSNWKKVKNIKEVDLKFTKFEENNQGITVENDEGIRCLVSGHKQYPVREMFAKQGEVTITIRHLGKTKMGKFRQPVFAKVVQ
jgi:ATP-dependent DNA ligase